MLSTRRKETKNQYHKAKPGKWVARLFVFFLISLGFGSGVVAADYIGPNRTYTVEEPTSCGYRYSASGYDCSSQGYTGVSCTCNITCDDCLTPSLNCISLPQESVRNECGRGFSHDDTWVNSRTITISHPPAVASTVWSCPISGDNGWCQSQFAVQLYAVDPLSGYYITALEGLLDSVPFFANAVDTISFWIGEGAHHLDFWALSSYGDSSTHFIENYFVDTRPPQINATLSGTPGDNNWFVTDTTLTVLYSDPVPGSGLASNSATSNGMLIDVSVPVTFPEGVYDLEIDVRATAGLTAQTLYTLMVDTTAPALSANQPPPESGIYMNGSVIFSGMTSDATSGVNRIEVAPDGVNWQPATLNPDGSWILDWDSSVKPDDTYTPRVASTDNAGNRTEISLQPITLDNSAPPYSLRSLVHLGDGSCLCA